MHTDRVTKFYARQAPLQDECDHTLNTQDRIPRSTTSGEIVAEAPSHLVTISPHYLITPQGNSPILDVRGQRALYVPHRACRPLVACVAGQPIAPEALALALLAELGVGALFFRRAHSKDSVRHLLE